MARQNYDFLDAFATMINQHDWSHWCTFTTQREMTLRGARRFAKNIALDFCMPTILCNETRFLWAAEPFDVKDGYHIHALIYVPKTWKGLKQIETSNKICSERYSLMSTAYFVLLHSCEFRFFHFFEEFHQLYKDQEHEKHHKEIEYFQSYFS
jgi:hypothetical protein